MRLSDQERLAKAKFVGDLKPIIAAQAEQIERLETELRGAYKAMRRCEAVLLEHAKLLDPAAFHEEVDVPPTPAEAATDAPTDETTEEPGDRSQEKAPPPPVS